MTKQIECLEYYYFEPPENPASLTARAWVVDLPRNKRVPTEKQERAQTGTRK